VTRILKIELNVFRKTTHLKCSQLCEASIFCLSRRVTHVRVRRPDSLLRIPLRLQVPDWIAAYAVLEAGCDSTVTIATLLWLTV